MAVPAHHHEPERRQELIDTCCRHGGPISTSLANTLSQFGDRLNPDQIVQEILPRLKNMIRSAPQELINSSDQDWNHRLITHGMDAAKEIVQQRFADALDFLLVQDVPFLPGLHPDDRLRQQEYLPALRKKFWRLPVHMRSAFKLHLAGFTYEDIAIKLDISADRVRILIKEAKLRFYGGAGED